jgi:glycosyltransferase involved in cell wall biosynthesis
LRRADRRWAQGVTRFIANSHNVAARIRRNYGRDADVLYPPIDTEFWSPGGEKKDFFLFAGRLVPYKRPGVAVATATALGVPLVVAGSGPLLADLRRKAGPNITFIENPSREHLRDLYRETKALVFPGVEDFGMTLVEAQACGTPVIASAQGGALEAVNDGVTGYLYEEEGIDGLSQAIDSFDPSIYEITSLRAHAELFAIPRFDESLRQIVDRVVATGQ